MTEDQHFMLEAAEQKGFQLINDDDGIYTATDEQIVALVTAARKQGQEDRDVEIRELRAYLKAFCAATVEPEDRDGGVGTHVANPTMDWAFQHVEEDDPQPDRCITGAQVRRAMELVGYDRLKIEAPEQTIAEELAAARGAVTFQARNQAWLDYVCKDDATDLEERVARFVEEALELAQSLGLERNGAMQLVHYVFDRPVGEPAQEFGGAVNTLAVLADFTGRDMLGCGERELARVWAPEVIAKIRGKRSRRHGRGVLPGMVEADVVPAG